MYRTPTSGLGQEFMTGLRWWAGLTALGSVMAIAGMIVLPWFNKAAEFRAGAGLTFFQWHEQTQSMVPYWVALVAYAAIAIVAFTTPTTWSAWAGIVLASITFADASWKMSAMLLVPTPLELTIGVGYYALMAGAALVLVGSVMRLVFATKEETQHSEERGGSQHAETMHGG
jgi:hypothetical protein